MKHIRKSRDPGRRTQQYLAFRIATATPKAARCTDEGVCIVIQKTPTGTNRGSMT